MVKLIGHFIRNAFTTLSVIKATVCGLESDSACLMRIIGSVSVCITAQIIISTALIRSCWFIAVFIERRTDLHFPCEKPDVASGLLSVSESSGSAPISRTPVVQADLMQSLCEVSALLQLSRWFSCETVQSSLKSEICWTPCQFWCYESLVPWLGIGAYKYWV